MQELYGEPSSFTMHPSYCFKVDTHTTSPSTNSYRHRFYHHLLRLGAEFRSQVDSLHCLFTMLALDTQLIYAYSVTRYKC